VTGDLEFLSGDRATDRGSVSAAGRSVRRAMAGLILGFGLPGVGTFGGVGLIPVGVTSLDLSALGWGSSTGGGTSGARPRTAKDSCGFIMFCGEGR